LKAGDTIFYPAHGVAKVRGIEELTFGDHKQKFYVLELRRGGRSMVPVDNIEHAGLRPLVSERQAKSLIKSLKNQPIIDNRKTWKDRASQYAAGLKTGEPESYTAILQELMYRARADKLSTTETKMLETARSYFVAEVGEVLDLSPDDLDRELNAAIRELLPDIPDHLGDDDDLGDDEVGDSEDEADGEESDAESGDDDAPVPSKKAGKKAKKAEGGKTAKKTSKKKAPAKKKAAKKAPKKK
jgi:CarD family transcriptional regulator